MRARSRDAHGVGRSVADAGFPPMAVDLLPPAARRSRRSRRARRATVAVSISALLVAGGIAWQAATDLAGARREQDAATEANAALFSARAEFSELTSLDAEIERMTLIEGSAMARHVHWSALVDEALAALTSVAESTGSPLVPSATTVQITALAPEDEPTGESDLLGVPGIGNMQIDVQTASLPDAGQWTTALQAIAGLTDARMVVSVLEQSDPGAQPHYTSSVTVTITEAARSCRWVPGAGEADAETEEECRA